VACLFVDFVDELASVLGFQDTAKASPLRDIKYVVNMRNQGTYLAFISPKFSIGGGLRGRFGEPEYRYVLLNGSLSRTDRFQGIGGGKDGIYLTK
jgi:hypothetical protein